MKKAICPGSFDPFTLGHFDIVKRAAKVFDEVVVAVLVNSEKKAMLPASERKRLIELCTAELPNVSVVSSEGLLCDLAREHHADAIVKGVRGFSDFENESHIAVVNKNLSEGELETVLLFSDPAHLHISSTVVREYIKFGLPCLRLLPREIICDLAFKKEFLDRK